MIEIINKPLLLHLVGYLYYRQMGFNSVFKGLNIASHASGIRTIRQFDRAVKNNTRIKNNDDLKFVKRIFCSAFLFVTLLTFFG